MALVPVFPPTIRADIALIDDIQGVLPAANTLEPLSAARIEVEWADVLIPTEVNNLPLSASLSIRTRLWHCVTLARNGASVLAPKAQ